MLHPEMAIILALSICSLAIWCSSALPHNIAILNGENSKLQHLEKPEKSEAMRQWLEEDTISIEQFDLLFGSPREFVPKDEPSNIYGLKFAVKGGKQFETAIKKLDKYRYNDTMVRQKFFPMAAAAYGDRDAIVSCLRNTFEEAELHKNLVMYCEGEEDQFCSGFVALLHSEKAILLSFRGTDSKMQLMDLGLDILLTSPIDGIDLPGKVGSYFQGIHHQLLANVVAVLELNKKYPNYEIWLTGHSLGGSLASLAAANIHARKVVAPEKIRLITLGQPRTGDRQWAKAMDEALPFFNYRVVNHRDLVPHLPPSGYLHFMTEIWYNSGMEENADFVECATENEDDRKCSNSLRRGISDYFDFTDHREYFGKNVALHGIEGCPVDL